MSENEIQETVRTRRNRRLSGALAVAVMVIAIAGFALAGTSTSAAASVGPVTTIGSAASGGSPATAGNPVTGGAPPAALPASSHVVIQKPSDASYAQMGPAAVGASAGGATSASIATPGCSTAPCPMGITDYGIYANNTGVLKSTSYNATVLESYFDTGTILGLGYANGGGCLDPDAVADGCFTVQQNAIVKGLEVKNHVGEYWIQNVPEVAYDASCSSPCVSGTFSVTWLDNIWNFSYDKGICPSDRNTGAGCINPKTIAGNWSGACSMTGGAPTFYYCVGPTIYNLTLPFSINAWETVNSFGNCVSTSTRTCVNLYGEIEDRGSYLFGQYYDGVSFASGKTVGKPYFHVQHALTPLGLPYDYEWVFGGPGGGSTNVVETYGDLQSFHCLSTCTTYSNYLSIAHAWSSGYDTGESIDDVYVIPNLNPRDQATLDFAADNPQTEIW